MFARINLGSKAGCGWRRAKSCSGNLWVNGKKLLLEFPSFFSRSFSGKLLGPQQHSARERRERGSRVKITFSCLRVIHIFINNQKSVASFFTALLNVRGIPLFGGGMENSNLSLFSVEIKYLRMRELFAAVFSSCVLKMLFRDALLFNSIVRDNQKF